MNRPYLPLFGPRPILNLTVNGLIAKNEAWTNASAHFWAGVALSFLGPYGALAWVLWTLFNETFLHGTTASASEVRTDLLSRFAGVALVAVATKGWQPVGLAYFLQWSHP